MDWKHTICFALLIFFFIRGIHSKSFQSIDFEENLIQTENTTTQCGGVLEHSRGYIRYKENATYENNERCLWTIKTPRIATAIMMRAEGFHSSNDHIRIYIPDTEGNLELFTKITSKELNIIFKVPNTLIFLSFTTDRTGQGTGFMLEYFQFAYTDLSGFKYTQLDTSESGIGKYPVEPANSLSNDVLTYNFLPPQHYGKNELILSLNQVGIATLANTGCQYNYFVVYELYRDTMEPRMKFCEKDLDGKSTIKISSAALVMMFASVSPNFDGIELSWSYN